MCIMSRLLRVFCCSVVLLSASFISAAPTVSDPVLSERTDKSGLVDIRYKIVCAERDFFATLLVSNDDGKTWELPTSSLLKGDIGNVVKDGEEKQIIWDAGCDRQGLFGPQTKAQVRVTETGQTVTIMLPGNLHLEMVKIPAGPFSMGSLQDPDFTHENERPARAVVIPREFYLGKYEVTQAQWRAITQQEPSVFKGENNPVENITWLECQDFIAKLNTLNQGKFRLPSEAEWEYACRAGTITRWTFGNDEALLKDYAWYKGNDEGAHHPVGQKLPNRWELYDMHGNVWEWVEDWCQPNYNGAPVDGSAVLTQATDRIIRGGAYYFEADSCRSAYRGNGVPTVRYSCLGLRLAMDAIPATQPAAAQAVAAQPTPAQPIAAAGL